MASRNIKRVSLARYEKKSDRQTPKITPLPGFIETRYVKCGHLNCHCTTSKGHGPYYYRVYRKGKRKFKEYVKEADLPFVSACIAERRRIFKIAAEFNQESSLYFKKIVAQLRDIDQQLKSIE